jgi:hypothetical protein
MAKRVREIRDLIIDEVSLVDRGANQHAAVTIAKSYDGEEDQGMDIYDEQGNPLDADSLEDGAIVYGEDGQAYLFELGDDDEAEGVHEDDLEAEYEEELEPELVGKAFNFNSANRWARTVGRGGKPPRGAKDSVTGIKGQLGGPKGKKGPKRNDGGVRGARASFGEGHAKFARNHPSAHSALIYGGGGAAAAGVGGATYYGVKKNMGAADILREELSKALNDDDRDYAISKALEAVDAYADQAAEAEEIAKAERELRLDREYTEIAKSYNLPVHPEVLGPVMKRLAEYMSDEDCEVIAKCFEAASEALFEETGYMGGGDNVDIYQQVEAAAMQHVGKAGVSHEQVVADLFDMNPGAYDEYLAETQH